MLLPWRGRTGHLVFIGLFVFVFLSASWTLAASLVENSLTKDELNPIRVAAVDPVDNPLPAKQNEPGLQASRPPAATVETTPDTASQPRAGSVTGDLDPAPPPASPAEEAPVESVLPAGSGGEEAESAAQANPAAEEFNQAPPAQAGGGSKDALRLAAFPAKQFSPRRLGHNPDAGKRIALTFDDGPMPGWTEKYLEVLREHRVPATFFFIGQYAAKDPDLVRVAAADGHDIGAHSNTHKKLSLLKKEQVEAELWEAGITLYSITSRPVAYFRPPYGATNENVSKAAEDLGQTVILWNVDPRDWETANAQKIANHVVNHVRPGSIILLHEGKAETLKALPVIVDKLREQGYEFVTVAELFGHSTPQAEEHVVVSAPVSRGFVTR